MLVNKGKFCPHINTSNVRIALLTFRYRLVAKIIKTTFTPEKKGVNTFLCNQPFNCLT